MSNGNEVAIEQGTPIEGFTFDEAFKALVYKTLLYVKRVGTNEERTLRITAMCWLPDDIARFQFVDEGVCDDEGRPFRSYLCVKCCAPNPSGTSARAVLWNPIPTD